MIQRIKQLKIFQTNTIEDYSELSGGRCNQAFRLHTKQHGDLVCVVQKNNANLDAQIAIHQQVSELKVCPPLLHSEVIDDQRFSVMKYIKGRHQSAHLWRKEKRQAFAQQLTQVHQLYQQKPNNNWPQLNLVEHILDYQNQLPAQSRGQFKQSIDYLVPRLSQLEQPVLGLCHHDLNPKNLITESDDSIVILDWEFAAVGDVYFDLACFVVEHLLTTTQTDIWLQDYWQVYNQKNSNNPHKFDNDKFNLYKQSYQLVCDLWHQLQL